MLSNDSQVLHRQLDSQTLIEKSLTMLTSDRYQNVSLWLKYLEMEMKNKFVNHARNLFDRVPQPRLNMLAKEMAALFVHCL